MICGNEGGIEEFEVDVRERPLKNFGVCLALMPNLKKLTVLGANEEYGSDFFQWLLRWECNSLEEIVMTGKGLDFFDRYHFAFQNQFPQLKKVSYQKLQTFVQEYSPQETQ